MNRRHFLVTLSGGCLLPTLGSAATNLLPLSVTCQGQDKFHVLAAKAVKEQWATKPIGQRMAFIAITLRETPYVGFTLEIDDRIECPSVNFAGLDCWTFFETVLGLARMLETPREKYQPEHLLAEIEWTRYRAGKCTGDYLERIHYLNEWFLDNHARGNINDITRQLGADIPLKGRVSREMTILWKSYRYLRKNPELRPKMAELETKINQLPVHYIPKAKVKGIEPQLRNGDIIGIVSGGQGGVCSHVGLILRTSADPAARFTHASSNYKKVTVDLTISEYLALYKSDIGILVARPLPTNQAVRDSATYQANLQRIIQANS